MLQFLGSSKSQNSKDRLRIKLQIRARPGRAGSVPRGVCDLQSALGGGVGYWERRHLTLLDCQEFHGTCSAVNGHHVQGRVWGGFSGVPGSGPGLGDLRVARRAVPGRPAGGTRGPRGAGAGAARRGGAGRGEAGRGAAGRGAWATFWLAAYGC